jgi:hypothetical protein
VLIAVLLFTGCGSDSSTTASVTAESSETTAAESPSGPLTKAEFIKEAKQICREGSNKKEEAILSLAKLATESNKPPSPQAVEKVATVVVFPTYSEVLDQISQLEAPKGDEGAINEVLRKYEADLESAEASPIKAAKVNMFADANDAGDAYGLKSCHF